MKIQLESVKSKLVESLYELVELKQSLLQKQTVSSQSHFDDINKINCFIDQIVLLISSDTGMDRFLETLDLSKEE